MVLANIETKKDITREIVPTAIGIPLMWFLRINIKVITKHSTILDIDVDVTTE